MKAANLSQYPKTVAQINKQVQKKYPEVMLVRGNGYFYVVSDNDEWATKLGYLDTTAIYTNALGDLTLGKWVADVTAIVEKAIANYEAEYAN